jgi:O-antigen/teichoic acid export membrane protein
MKLQKDMLITLLANLALAISQWLLIANLNQSGNVEIVGKYAYSLALAGIFLTIGQMGLRQFVMSKWATEELLEQVFTTRLITTCLAWCLLVAYTIFVIDEKYFWLVILLGLAKIPENLSDIAHGLYQRNFRVYEIAKSRFARSLITPLIFLIVFFETNNLEMACFSIIVSWFLIFVLFDFRAFKPNQRILTKVNLLSKIISQSYPMGIATILVMVTVNIPLFMLARYTTDIDIGKYSSIFYFVTAGSLILQSALQVISPIIVMNLQNGHYCKIKKITVLSYLFSSIYGIVGIFGAYYLGESMLSIFYGENFTNFGSMLIVAAFINLAIAFQSVGGIGLTAHGVFKFQMVVMLTSLFVCGVSSWFLIKHFGVVGALYAGVITAVFNGVMFAIKLVIEINKNAKIKNIAHS